MIVHIKIADYLENYKLYLTFNIGESGEVDLEDIVFKYSAAAPLRNIEDFKTFELDEWSTVVWNYGFDVSPETLYERATQKRIEWLTS